MAKRLKKTLEAIGFQVELKDQKIPLLNVSFLESHHDGLPSPPDDENDGLKGCCPVLTTEAIIGHFLRVSVAAVHCCHR